MNYLSAMPSTAPVYRGVGKAYMKTERTEIDRRLESEMGASTKNLRDLGDRQEYLERRLQSSVQNYKDLTVGL
jgi:chaperonin cofactor prefoldin